MDEAVLPVFLVQRWPSPALAQFAIRAEEVGPVGPALLITDRTIFTPGFVPSVIARWSMSFSRPG